jgi:hypothetical protein
MKTERIMVNTEAQRPSFPKFKGCVLLLSLFFACHLLAQHSNSDFSWNSQQRKADVPRKVFGAEITNNGFGGPAIKFSRFNDQFAFMTGGRGTCIINNRFTIGGGGYGIANSIRLESPEPEVSRNLKMGYGGPEFGYIFYPGKIVNFGGSLLIAAGAAFWEINPKIKAEKIFSNDFRIFPVLEPSLFVELSLNRFMRLHTGISYRYAKGAESLYIHDKDLRGLSIYTGLLFGKV